MAHFAEIDELGYVLRVIVIANDEIVDDNGIEQEQLGVAQCQELFGGEWVQTSYHANMREKFAAPGDYYDKERDMFR